MHGVQVSCGGAVTLDGYNSRHLGDDNFVVGNSACLGSPAYVTGRNWHCQFMGGNGGSASFIDPQNAEPLCGSFERMVADDCVSNGATILGVIQSSQNPPIPVVDAVFWGNRNGITANDPRWVLSELIALGTLPQDANLPLVPNSADHFVVRDSRQLAANGNSELATGVLDFKNGSIHDVELAKSSFNGLQIYDGSSLENLALLDIETSGTCSGSCGFMQIKQAPPYAGLSIRRVLLGYSPGHVAQAQIGLDLPYADPGPGLQLDGIRISGFDQTLTGEAAFDADSTYGQGRRWRSPPRPVRDRNGYLPVAQRYRYGSIRPRFGR